jgi:hypothetical protein
MFLDHFISEKYKQYDNYSHISFHIVPLCKYTLLPVTVKALETFHFAKSFSALSFILNDVVIIKRASPSVLILVEGTGKISWSRITV